MDIVFLVYGFAFLALGLIIHAQPREGSNLELARCMGPLAAFGLSHGLLEWVELWGLLHGETPFFAIAKPSLLLVSYVFLAEFGRRLVQCSVLDTKLSHLLDARLFVLPLAGLFAVSASTDQFGLALTIGARYLFGFTGSLLAGIGCVFYYRRRLCSALSDTALPRIKLASHSAAVAFIAYGILAGLVVPRAPWFPATWINQESFQALWHVPVQWFRVLCALAITVSMAYLLRVFHIEGRLSLTRALDAAQCALDQAHRLSHRNEIILRSVADGVYGIDAAGQAIFINQTALEMLGFSEEELLGKNVHTLIHHTTTEGKPYPIEQCPIFQTMRDGRQRRFDQDVFWRKDGGDFPVECRVAPIIDAGERIGAVVAFQDISERLRAEALLRAALDAADEGSRAKSVFLANMSHELHTPLNGVLGMASLLLDSQLDDEQREFAGYIQQSARSLCFLLDGLLDYARLEAGKSALEPIDFNLRELLDATLRRFEARAVQKQLSLSHWIDAHVPTLLHGDAARLQRVLLRLLDNALKFTARGEVCLRVYATAGSNAEVWLRFEVEDTGLGIPAEKLDGLFAPFTQVDAALNRQFDGIGLGLALAKQLVTSMGGKIGVESVYGAGTLFWFNVPFALSRQNHEAIPHVD